MKTENLNLTTEWDKVYPRNEKVDHKKVTFVNHFGITLAADMFIPKDAYENTTKDSKYTANKELLIIPGASHTDLYDQMNIIPFDKMQSFFEEYLK